MKLLSEYSVLELRQVIAIKEQLESLCGQLEALTGGADGAGQTEGPSPANRVKRRLSPAHRRKLIKALARARKIRWAKAKSVSTPKKRRMSKAGRAAISAAAKARWAKVKAANS